MIGVDGCQGQVMIAKIADNNVEIGLSPHLECLKNETGLILMDVPLGCPSSMHEVRPEPHLRQLMKGKASSVFNVPSLQTLEVSSYEEANQLHRLIMSKGLSRQSYHLLPLIKMANTFVLEYPHLNVHESFPELVFQRLNHQALRASKHTLEGRSERYEILIYHAPYLQSGIVSAFQQFPTHHHADILDACALAYAGLLIQKYGAETIPTHPMKNSQGIEMKVLIFKEI